MLILILVFTYTRNISEDFLFEKAIKQRNYQFYNARFSYPSRFISSLLYDYDPSKPISFWINLETQIDTSQSLGLYPTFLYDKQNYGVVIEPLFKIGNTEGWPYLKWHNKIAGAFSRAYFFYDRAPLTLFIGRNRLQLNLEGLLAEEDPPADLFFASYRTPHINFSFFTGQLDSRISQDSTSLYPSGKLFNRFISGHSIEGRGKNYSLSFSEIAIYFTETNQPDPYFLNPFTLYHTRFLDTEEHGEHNVFWILSASYWGAKFLSQFEFLIDDWHIPDVDVWGPNKFAWIFRTYFVDLPLRGMLSGISYTGATRWVYVHRCDLLYFNNKSETMGILNDNDFDSLSIFFRKPLKGPKSWAKLTLSYKRKGEGSVRDKDYIYYMDSGRPKTFLSGIIEHRLGSSIDIEITSKNSHLILKASYQKILNNNHINVQNSSRISAKLIISKLTP